MAQRKSMADIVRNEKYVDDAVFSAFMNLHKAAKRKSEYIWATERFTSLDSIWGDPMKPENKEVIDVTSSSIKTPEHQPKPLKQQYGGVYTNHQITSQPNRTDKEDIKLKSDDARKIESEFHRRNPNANTNYELSSQNCGDINPVEIDHSRHHFEKTELTPPLVGNCTVNAIRNIKENKDVKSHNGSGFQTNYQRYKMRSCEMLQVGKTTEKPKRKRHLFTSVTSLPDWDHLPTENQNRDTACGSDKRSDMLKTMLVLKIIKGDKIFEFTLELSSLKRMKKRFPKLKEVFPEIDGGEKELCYSADAIKIVLGFLLNLRYDAPDERTAVEVLAAIKSWEMNQFYAVSQQKFLKNLNGNNINLVYGAAIHYGLSDICDAYKCTFSDDLSNDVRRYRQRKCNVSLSTYVEPREFCFPSNAAISTLNDSFDRDIRNVIVFKAITGSYVITGFHILLNMDNEREISSTDIDFYYIVKNLQNSYEEEAKVRKFLRSNIAINLKRNLEVNQDQIAEIVVETSIKPYLCLAIQEDSIAEKCDERQFDMTIKSTYKVANSNEKRFFIGKLLYYPKT